MDDALKVALLFAQFKIHKVRSSAFDWQHVHVGH
jgi:hypothetical protein